MQKTAKTDLKAFSAGLVLKNPFAAPGDLREALKAAVIENVNQIKSFPQEFLGDARDEIMRSLTVGNGLADLVPYLQQHCGLDLKHARLIAHEQTIKAHRAMNKIRMKKNGTKKFTWLCSGADDCVWCKQNSDKEFFVSDNIENLIRENCTCNPYCKCRMYPIINFGS